jgi:hypothetical protein
MNIFSRIRDARGPFLSKSDRLKRREDWILIARALLVLFACGTVVLFSPYMAIEWHPILPRGVTNYLYFVPQFTFPYGRFVVDTDSGAEPLLTYGIGMALNTVHWVILSLGYLLVVKRLNGRFLTPIAVTVVFLSPLVAVVAFALAGIRLELNGP